MASKAIYAVTAVAGIAVASAAAWWFQKPSAPVDSPGKPGANAAAPPDSPPKAPANGAASAGKPLSVEVAKVEVARLVDDTQAVGSLRSRRGVVLRPEVSGRITQLNFTDGQRVRKGQVLVQFDDQLPLAQIQQSQAELSIAQANQKRNQELVAENFISKRSLDESAANLQVAQAKLALAKATAARLRIVAPFDGIAGIRQVNVGDYLKDGSDIVNIEDMEAIYVDFRLPERFQGKISRGQTARLGIDSLPGRTYLAQIQAIDPLIDSNGRSIGVRGCVDNRQLQLRPGMFARVTTIFGVRENARVVPEEAIVPQGGKQYVIKVVGSPGDTRTSLRVEVKIGLRIPGKVEIVEGVELGETVVVSGQQRLQKDGTQVSVVDVSTGANGRATRSSSPASPAADTPLAGASAAARQPVSGAGNMTPSASAVAAKTAAVLSDAAKQAPASPSGSNPCGATLADAGQSVKADGERRMPAAERSRPFSRDPA
jgi:membrane fusion protein, multidrug efflux system